MQFNFTISAQLCVVFPNAGGKKVEIMTGFFCNIVELVGGSAC
jgi:hypothetical protein